MSHVFAQNVLAPEGPTFTPDGGFFIVEMAAERASVTRISDEGVRTSIATTAGRPNGLACDGDGNLWVAEAHEGSLLCYDESGELLMKVIGDGEGRFLWPNDLMFGPDGLLYMTDSGVLDDDFIIGQDVRGDFKDVSFDGRVYQIDPATGKVLALIDRGIRFTNGLAFNASGTLFVNETVTGNIYRYREKPDGTFARELFANVLRDPDDGGFRGPDGMKFGADGCLYCAVLGLGEIAVVDVSGQVVDRLPTRGSKPTNLIFAPGQSRLYVTEVEHGCVELLDVKTTGLALHMPLLVRA